MPLRPSVARVRSPRALMDPTAQTTDAREVAGLRSAFPHEAHTEPAASPHEAHTEPAASPHEAYTEPAASPHEAYTEPAASQHEAHTDLAGDFELRGPAVSARLNGIRLVEGELAQLQLALPGALPEWLKRLYLELPLAGAGVELREGSLVARGPRTRLVFFGVERMIEELLFHAPGRETIEHRRLPVAGCGRRTLLTYYVQLDGPDAGQLWVSGAGNERQLRPLSLALAEVLERSVSVAGLRVRRRLGLSMAAKPATTRKPRRAGTVATCRRTLDLFESCA